jgi:glycerol uptake facilitator-like aquaporin
MGVVFMLASLVAGLVFAVVAVLIIIYGVYSARSSQMVGAFPSESTVAEKKSRRTTQEMYQDTVAEFIKSFGAVHGILMLENRIEAYTNEGLSREEAIRKIVEDLGY